jgi:ubiquitin-protein ligase
MRDSPRIRRLRTDYKALEKLREESSIIEFETTRAPYGQHPEAYLVRFRGKGLWRPERSSDVLVRDQHEVAITLGASYPRMMPELSWRSPIFHPNISAGGIVCLGGYGTHWVPSLNLDELCGMLWDMIRYQNFDVESPYNREAALWAKTQRSYRLPVDVRPLRDRVAGLSAKTLNGYKPPVTAAPTRNAAPHDSPFAQPDPTPGVFFIDGEAVVEAEIVEPEDPDILFIE